MRKTLLALTGAAALTFATGANAAVVIDFNSPTGNVGTSEIYGDPGTTVTAYGYVAGSAANLYGKSQGGDENGLGLAADPTGQHEIFYDARGGTFVALDVTDLFGDATDASVFFGSTSGGESWSIYGSDLLGTLGDLLLTGSSEGSLVGLPNFGDYNYYNFVSNNGGGKNVLLGGLSYNPAAVPEPATWAMMLLGFGAVGFSMRRRNKVMLSQIA